MENEKLEQAIRSIELGNKAAALPILAQVLREDPKNDEAWIWMAAAVDDHDRKKQCLQQALAINPENLDALRELSYLESEQEVDAFVLDESEPVSLAGQVPTVVSQKPFTEDEPENQPPFTDETVEDQLRAEVFTMGGDQPEEEVVDASLSEGPELQMFEPVDFTSTEVTAAPSRRRSRSRTKFSNNQILVLGIMLIITLAIVIAAVLFIITNL